MHPPDIVLLVLDTQRADRLSCYGGPEQATPHLDRFAAVATRFTQAVAPAQWTIPSHASMFTGCYPSQHKLLQKESVLPETLPTLAEQLQQAGYFTAAFSNNPLVGILKNGLTRGFDTFVNYAGAEYRQSNQTEVKGWQRLWLRFMARIEAALVESPAAQKIIASPWMWSLLGPILWRDENVKGDTTQSLADAARLLIERPSGSPDQPLFVFINLMGAHWPYNPPDWAVTSFLPQLKGQPIGDFVKQFNADMRNWEEVLTRPLAADQKAILDGLYNAEVAAQDAQLGLFFEQLEKAGVWNKTFFITVADHGEQLGEKELVGHDYGAYREVIHVPLLIRDPRGILPAGVVEDSPVSIRRLFHTALTVAGAASPEVEALALSCPAVDDLDLPFFAESWPPEKSYLPQADHRHLKDHDYDQAHLAVYDGNHKLIATEDKCVGLYAIVNDPAEKEDLQQLLPGRVRILQETLLAFRQQQEGIVSGGTLAVDDLALVERLRALGYME